MDVHILFVNGKKYFLKKQFRLVAITWGCKYNT